MQAKKKGLKRPRKPVVVHRLLGREKAWGLQSGHRIDIDARLSGKAKLEVLLHEWMHWRHPELAEKEVNSDARLLAQFLWDHRIRVVEPGDTLVKQPPRH